MLRNLLRKVKRKINILIGNLILIKKDIKCNHIWCGSIYGGFYINPDFLNSDSIIYSFGVGQDISFEKEIIEKYNCNIFSFDPTPKSVEWIKNQEIPNNLTFLDYGINFKTGFVAFNLPKNHIHISGSIIKYKNLDENNSILVFMKSFTDIVNNLGHKNIDILKMDIEGSEFDVIENILNSKIEISQILIELHPRFFADGRKRVFELLEILKNNGYGVFAVSDSLNEVSFIKLCYN